MISTVRSISLMLVAPVVLLLLWAHFVRPTISGLDVLAMFTAGLLGLTGVATSAWPSKTKATVAVCYIALACFVVPFATLLAVCATGDCL